MVTASVIRLCCVIGRRRNPAAVEGADRKHNRCLQFPLWAGSRVRRVRRRDSLIAVERDETQPGLIRESVCQISLSFVLTSPTLCFIISAPPQELSHRFGPWTSREPEVDLGARSAAMWSEFVCFCSEKLSCHAFSRFNAPHPFNYTHLKWVWHTLLCVSVIAKTLWAFPNCHASLKCLETRFMACVRSQEQPN